MNTFDNIARTQWFPLWPYASRNTEGLMPGVYEVEVIDVVFSDFVELRKEHLFSYWDGKYWYLATNTPEGSLRNRVREEIEWRTISCFRGLAENPNNIHVEPWDNDEWVDPKLEHLKDTVWALDHIDVSEDEFDNNAINAAIKIIEELIQSIESTYETVA